MSLLKRWGIGVGVAAGIVVIGFLIAQSTGGGVSVAGDLRQGGQLPSFSLPALQDSGTISYDSMKDKPLVLNFFASWCPFCVGEMPGFERVHQSLGSNVTVFIKPGGQIAEIHTGALDARPLQGLTVQYFGQQYAAAA